MKIDWFTGQPGRRIRDNEIRDKFFLPALRVG